jgi:enoyl-CoA hydratase/carnithine racemase
MMNERLGGGTGRTPGSVEAGDAGVTCQTRDVYELLSLERRDDGVAVITLRNGKVNALSSALLAELEAAVGELAAELPGAVVITGGERIFAAGADIDEFAGQAEARGITERFHAANDAVAALDRFVIAAVSGYALGGGCELALACDYRIAGERAVFGQPEILLGIVPGGGGSQRLARLVGPSRAKELCITGRQVGAEEALRIGLADEVVAGDPHERACALAAEVAAGALAAQALCKRLIDDGLSAPLGVGLAAERAAFVEVFGTEDSQIGVASFRQHGPGKASFTGR